MGIGRVGDGEEYPRMDRGQVPEAQAGGAAEGEDAGRLPGAPNELREEDVTRADGLDDRVAEEELPGE